MESIAQATPSTPAEPFIDAAEAARRLLVTRDTVYRWAKAGVIPAHRVNKTWRFRASELVSPVARASHARDGDERGPRTDDPLWQRLTERER